MTTRWFPDEMPVPGVNAETNGWWEAAAQHRLVVQRCTACGRTRHPPGPICPHCRSTASEWSELPGTGSVFTFTVVRQAFIAPLADRIPYVVIAVELDEGEGARMVSNLVDIEPSDVSIGMRVGVAWEDMGPELAVPRFRPTPETKTGSEAGSEAGSKTGPTTGTTTGTTTGVEGAGP